MEHLGAGTRVRLGVAAKVFWAIIVASAGGFIWVGSIQARVDGIEADTRTISQKIDQVVGDTQYIRGKLDQMGKRK